MTDRQINRQNYRMIGFVFNQLWTRILIFLQLNLFIVLFGSFYLSQRKILVRDSFLTDQAAKVEVGHTLRRQAYYSTKTGTRQRSRHNSNWRRTVVEKARVWQCPELDEGCLLMPYASDER